MCLCRTGGLRSDHAEFDLRKRPRAPDHFLCGKSNDHKFRYEQHTDLGSNRSGEYCHHSGDVHLHHGKRIDKHEPNRDHYLHADCDQCRGCSNVYANHHRQHDKQPKTSYQFLHGQSHTHHLRLQQHVKLGNDRGHQHRHHAGDIYYYGREWFHKRESDGDKHLHVDRN